MKNMRNIRLELAFDGTDYHGWQYLPDQTTLQGVVQDVLYQILGEKTEVEGAGRTDAGVHALNFTANFLTGNTLIPVENIALLLNRNLPPSIRVKQAMPAPLDFHSRFSCTAREYLYFVWHDREIPPFYQRYASHEFRPIDIDRIRKCCAFFQGRHDFRSFCSAYPEGFDYTRTIYHFRARRLGPRIYYFIKGDGFLHGMIRDLVALTIQYSLGNVTRSDILSALQGETLLPSAFRTRAPAQGLYFKRAFYSKADILRP